MRYLICTFMLIHLTVSLFAQGEEFIMRPRNNAAKNAPPKKIIRNGSVSKQTTPPGETRFLTLNITIDIDGTLYLSDKEGRAVKKGELLTLPVFHENQTLFFTGPDNFAYKEQLSFTPNQRGSVIIRNLELEKLLRFHRQKQIDQLTEAQILEELYQEMIIIEPEENILPSFEIGQKEITIAQYSVFANSMDRKERAETDSSFIITIPSGIRRFRQGIDWQYDPTGILRPKSEYNHPVVNVSWLEAMAFCGWLTAHDPVYEYRLPKAAEWEYIGSCGGLFRYPWGDDLMIGGEDSIPGNTADLTLKNAVSGLKDPVSPIADGFAFTSPGGRFFSPCFGVMDMAGNVAEWVLDDQIRHSAGRDIVEKQVKGGSFFNMPKSCMVHSSASRPPDMRLGTVGFRVVRIPK